MFHTDEFTFPLGRVKDTLGAVTLIVSYFGQKIKSGLLFHPGLVGWDRRTFPPNTNKSWQILQSKEQPSILVSGPPERQIHGLIGSNM